MGGVSFHSSIVRVSSQFKKTLLVLLGFALLGLPADAPALEGQKTGLDPARLQQLYASTFALPSETAPLLDRFCDHLKAELYRMKDSGALTTKTLGDGSRSILLLQAPPENGYASVLGLSARDAVYNVNGNTMADTAGDEIDALVELIRATRGYPIVLAVMRVTEFNQDRLLRIPQLQKLASLGL
jgi:hypothetical protein